MNNKLIVTGGNPLYGSVRVGGAKNASWKVLIASLLGDSQSRLLNFSHISDVDSVLEIINSLGAEGKQVGERAIYINPEGLSSFHIEEKYGAGGRYSTMFIPVLLHKFKKAIVPAPGGDKIGRRPLDRHFDGLVALGAKIKEENGNYYVEADQLIGTHYLFEKNSHTGTETMLLAAVKAHGRTILENAAEEPEIDDLIEYLNDMGAWIRRKPGRIIEIEGVEQLQGSIHKLVPDRNESVTYACSALITKGDVIIENARPEHLKAFLDIVDQMGGGFEVGNYGIRIYYKQPLQAVSITTGIEPGFMTDWQPLIASVLTQCQNESIIHETIMTQRFQYVPDLVAMGAKIELFQPQVDNKDEVYNFNLEDDKEEYQHAVKITGPCQLSGTTIHVKDLRHGATLINAALAASGQSIFENIDQIDRGYEDIEGRLKSIGANIVRI